MNVGHQAGHQVLNAIKPEKQPCVFSGFFQDE
jgi:hypothetical protein